MIFTILAIVFFAVGVGLILSANIITYKIIAEVNARAGPDQQFSLIFIQRKWPEVVERYRAFAPDSRLPQMTYILGIGGIILIFVGFIVLCCAQSSVQQTRAR